MQVQGAQAQHAQALAGLAGVVSVFSFMAGSSSWWCGPSPQTQAGPCPRGKVNAAPTAAPRRAIIRPMARTAPRPELAEAREQGFHNIGEAAAATGVSAKMIREYERNGLIPPAQRTFAGYRLYNDADLHRLHFIKRARNLGFPMKQVAVLLDLWNNRGRASADVKALALEHAGELRARIAEMQAMQRTLEDLARRCHGDARPDCPIIDGLAAPK
jgi:Cu(I)-responsive transcriptional regulator